MARAFAPPRTPCTLRLRELRHRTQDLTSPVAQSVSTGSSISQRTPSLLRRAGRHADRARTTHPRSLLRPTRSSPETPLVGSIPTLPPGWRLPIVKRFSPTHRQPLAPFSRTAVQAGQSRSRPPRYRYSQSCPQRTNALGRPSGRRCLSPTSATESVFTSTLGNPRSRAQGSHPADRRFRGRPISPAALPARERSSVYGGAERPRGPSDLEWRRAWHRSRQLEPTFDLPPSGPWPETVCLRRSSHSAFSALHEVVDQTPDAPCRAALPTRPSVGRAGF